MPLYKKLVLICAITVIALSSAVYWFVAFQCPRLIKTRISEVSGKTVSFNSVRAIFPDRLIFEDLIIEGLVKAPMARIIIDAGALLRGQVRISTVELLMPEININLSAGLMAEGKLLEVSPAVAATQVNVPDKASAVLVINVVRVRNGIVMVQVPSTGKTWIMNNVQVDLGNVPLGKVAVKTDFQISGTLEEMNMPFVGRQAKAKGWVNWAARDMDAKVEAVDEGGLVGFLAVLSSRANDCEVKGRVRLSSGQTAQASSKKSKMIEVAVLDLLSTLQSDIEASFSFHTKLDHFQVGQVSITGNIKSGLQSDSISGNIVGSLKSAGSKMLRENTDPVIPLNK